jgi:hypothetical protein
MSDNKFIIILLSIFNLFLYLTFALVSKNFLWILEFIKEAPWNISVLSLLFLSLINAVLYLVFNVEKSIIN